MPPNKPSRQTSDEEDFDEWLDNLRKTPYRIKKEINFNLDDASPIYGHEWLSSHQMSIFNMKGQIIHMECTAMALSKGNVICGFEDGTIRLYNWINFELTTEVNKDKEARPVRDICTTASRFNQDGFLVIAGKICQYVMYKFEDKELMWSYESDYEFIKIIDSNLGLFIFDSMGRIHEMRDNLPSRLFSTFQIYRMNNQIDKVIPGNISKKNTSVEGIVVYVTKKNYFAAIRLFYYYEDILSLDVVVKVHLNCFWEFPLLIATDYKSVFVAESNKPYLQVYPIEKLLCAETVLEVGQVFDLKEPIIRLKSHHSKVLAISKYGTIYQTKEESNSIKFEKILSPAMGTPNAIGADFIEDKEGFIMFIINDYGIISIKVWPEFGKNGVCDICSQTLEVLKDTDECKENIEDKYELVRTVICIHHD